MSIGNQLSIDCWLKIVYYLDLDDIISLSECYPQIREIFYFKSVVSDILIRNLTVGVTCYILNFPEDRRHLVETLDISYIRIEPHSALEKFIISLTGLTAFWAFKNMQKSTYKFILKKIGRQLHTLGIHENFGHHSSKRKLRKLKNLFIEASTGYSKIDLKSPCLRNLYRTNYKRAKIILDHNRLPDLELRMILKFARNVEYLWVEPSIQMDCNIEEFVNFKEFVLTNTADADFFHVDGSQAVLVRFYKSVEIKESQIIKKFGLRHLRYYQR